MEKIYKNCFEIIIYPQSAGQPHGQVRLRIFLKIIIIIIIVTQIVPQVPISISQYINDNKDWQLSMVAHA